MQASVAEKATLILVHWVDVEQVIAWKNGLFTFQSTPMHEMMRQIARWYDEEVFFKGDIKDEPITGAIPRSKNASEVLAILEYMRFKFKIDWKKAAVMS